MAKKKKHLILTREGEHHVTAHPDDYEGCTVLQRNVREFEHSKVVDGRLVEDTDRAAPPVPTVDGLADLVATLERRIVSLEQSLARAADAS